MTKYYVVKQGSKGPKLVMSKESEKDATHILKDTRYGSYYPLDLYSCIYSDKDTAILGSKIIPLSAIEIITKSDLETNMVSEKKELLLKPSKHLISDPYKRKTLGPMTRALLICIVEKGKDIALTREEHNRKLSLIRDVENIKNEGGELTPKKMLELLHLFGLKLHDFVRQNWVIG